MMQERMLDVVVPCECPSTQGDHYYYLFKMLSFEGEIRLGSAKFEDT